jgi:hypothetical protein
MAEDSVVQQEPKEEKLTLKSVASQVSELTKAVTALLQNKPSAPAATTPAVQVEGEPDKAVIPPSWRRVVDTVLGPEFGIDVRYPDEKSNGLFLFTVIVPKEKSNAPKDHWEMYKSDRRTKNIAGNPSVGEIQKHCERIKANLVRSQQSELVK